MSLHSNDSKREEYHRYLEKSGVIEYFSHVLVDLYETPEKPLDPNEYLREQLSKFFPDDTDDLRQEIVHHEEMLAERENTLHELQQQQYELRIALEAKGIRFDDLNLLDDDDDDDYDGDDNNVDYSTTQGGTRDDDDDDDDGPGEFKFDAENVPVFKYHQATNEELVSQANDSPRNQTRSLAGGESESKTEEAPKTEGEDKAHEEK